MIKGGLTKRYAQALLEIASEKGQIDEYGRQLREFVELLENNAELKQMIYGKVAATSAKKQVVEKLLGEDAVDIKKFIFVVMDKNRETALPQILTAYQDLCDEANGVQQISVQTAVPLSEAEEKALQEAFEKKLKAKIRLKTAVDKSLIGGIKVQIDDTLYDASLSQQLHALKQTLSVE
jgi:F-type H+-transporting ATPase subunit delta